MNHNDRLVLIAAVIVGVLALVGIYWAGAPSHIPQKGEERKDRYVPYAATESQHTVEEFPFDPNTADSNQLLRLGLQPWQVRNIYRYPQRISTATDSRKVREHPDTRACVNVNAKKIPNS